MRTACEAFVLASLVFLGTPASARVDFRADVEPVLQQHCYKCHGPAERKGGLRLTSRSEALEPGDHGVPVITEFSADASLLIDLVSSDDPDERMPYERDPLTPEEIDTLRRWIDQGAVWPDGPTTHWAYRTPARPSPPAVRREDWPRTTLDRFVLARLENRGVEPAPPADPSTLLRRVHLDLTGLPPSPAEVQTFLADPSPDAYDRVVDGLLASEAFGEHWATGWLDLARYADSTGFMSEVPLTNWPYRDWLIAAINGDMPFDHFTVEQIAGDLLPSPDLDQLTATGFHRAAPLNLEAGVREEDARVYQVIDRVNTTATVWLGTTLSCAQCHDHKYDPFTQEEYYRLLAFFDTTVKEAASRDGAGGVDLRPSGPTIELPHLQHTRDRVLTATEQMLDGLEEPLRSALPDAPPVSAEERRHAFTAAAEMDTNGVLAAASKIATDRLGTRPDWQREWYVRARDRLRDGAPQWKSLEITSFETREDDSPIEDPYRVLPDGSILLEGPPPSRATYILELSGGPARISALRIDALRHESLSGGGPGRRNAQRPDFVLSEVEVVAVGPRGEREVPVARAVASRHGAGGNPLHVLDGDVATGWSYAGDALGDDQWIVLVPPREIEGATRLRLTLRQTAGTGRTLGRLRVRATDEDASIVAMPPRLRQIVREDRWETADPLQRALLSSFARRGLLPGTNEAFDRAAAVFQRLPDEPRAHVMQEDTEPRRTHVYERGDHRTPGIEVSPGTPAALHPMPGDAPRNRLGLARWLVDPDNPLTARVVVNRWWARLLGRGLVPTAGDFGLRGSRPSHPELLDWLAVELVESGWSRKHLLREIVRSESYRQSSTPANPATLDEDPANRWLARNPARRLPAEAIRDNALQIAGLLSRRMGGPPVSPPQPPGVWRSNGATPARYVPSESEDQYRRGVYTIWRRTAPYASFANFDARDRTTCIVQRDQTNTPLQALTLLNDEVYVEAALAFAQRILLEKPDASTEERLRHAFLLALAREPTAEEMAILTALRASRVRAATIDAVEVENTLDAVSRFEPSPDVKRRELAVWIPVARAILNLDETIRRG